MQSFKKATIKIKQIDIELSKAGLNTQISYKAEHEFNHGEPTSSYWIGGALIDLSNAIVIQPA